MTKAMEGVQGRVQLHVYEPSFKETVEHSSGYRYKTGRSRLDLEHGGIRFAGLDAIEVDLGNPIGLAKGGF